MFLGVSIFADTSYNSTARILLTKKLHIKKTGKKEDVIIGYLYLRTSSPDKEESLSTIKNLIEIVEAGYPRMNKILVNNFSFTPYNDLRYVDTYIPIDMNKITVEEEHSTKTEMFLYTPMGKSWENQGNQLESNL